MDTDEDALAHALLRLRGVADADRADRVTRLLERLRAGQLRVLLVGEAKRGKSTLGNALLGRDVLPSGVTPLTAVTTTVVGGGPERLELAFADGRTEHGTVDDLAAYVTESGNPHNERGVRAATVYLDGALPQPGLALVDTPGLGSVLAHNTAEARDAQRAMDVALLVLAADPPISAAERDLLAQVNDLSVRTFVVVNKADRLTAAERADVEEFTRTVLAEVDLGDLPLLWCSARDGLRARLDGDTRAWRHSGVAAVAAAVFDALADSREQHLHASLRNAGQRTAVELLDEVTVTEAAVRARGRRESGAVEEFVQRLDVFGQAAGDAHAIVEAALAAARRELDRSAAETVPPVTGQVRKALEDFLSRPQSAGAQQLEDAGRELLAEAIRGYVETWRARRQAALEAAVSQAVGRTQQLADDATRHVQDAARDLLQVDLRAAPPVVALPGAGRFTYDVRPDVAWDAALSAAVRQRLPGAWGRRMAARRLRRAVEPLVDKHLGRARSQFADRLRDAQRQLQAGIAEQFTARHAGLAAALAAARKAEPGQVAAEQARKLAAQAQALAAVAAELAGPNEKPDPSARSSSRTGGHADDRPARAAG